MVSLSAMVPLNSVVSAFGKQDDTPHQSGLFKVPTEAQTDDRFTEENFSRYLNTNFLIYTTPLTGIRLQLVSVMRFEVDSKKVEAKHAKLDSFSVLFRGPRKAPLESKIYRISHDQMGTFDLFISPVNDSKKERTYQAVFNRFQS